MSDADEGNSQPSLPETETLEQQNERLKFILHVTRDEIERLKEEVSALSDPPNAYATFVALTGENTAEVLVFGRRMEVNYSNKIDIDLLVPGKTVIVNDSQCIVKVKTFSGQGDICKVVDHLDDRRVIINTRMDEDRVCMISGNIDLNDIKIGSLLLVDPTINYALELIDSPEASEVMLEVVPDISYDDVGGLDDQIEMLQDSVELPYLHPDIFIEHKLSPPKGILLYGPPGCGKTLIAKAVANSLAKKIENTTGKEVCAYFLNVKGPELLNKYVGETESKLREVFKKARDKASQDVPVVVFFDEMDSLFRTRGSGVSSDMEATVVAQFLAEIDGVEELENVIIIGATNRQDLIDPAVLRPGRLDLKIKVSRPDTNAARAILSKYLTPDLPLANTDDPEKTCLQMIDQVIDNMYSETDQNKFLEVTYARGEREIFYFKDFASGAMLENIVARAKRKAVKRLIKGGPKGITVDDLITSVREEFKENEDLPNTTNPDDWARISGRKGERIINVRTLITDVQRSEPSIETVSSGQGQYL